MLNNINLYIKGYSYDYNHNENNDNDFCLDILIGDLSYKKQNKEKDIAFVTFSNEILFPEFITILINFNKYNSIIEKNKKEILNEIQLFANSIDSRIPKNK